MWILLAALSAVCYGAADFCGGFASRRAQVLSILLASQLCGLALSVVAAPVAGPNQPTAADLVWGAAAGLAGAAGLGVFYRALASTVISVASPAAAVSGAALPVLFGFLLGERPSILAWAGLPLALAAVLALSLQQGRGVDRHAARRALGLGTIAGLGFAGFFILMSRTGPGSGLWPLVAARTTSVTGLLLATLIVGRPVMLPPGSRLPAVLAGVLDMAANVLYLLAARRGLVSLVAVVVSLYAAPTVLLARLVLREKLTGLRVAGLALAIAAVAMMSQS
jgi:drug/metabolite transporter (DMT)-like permease